MIGAGIFKFDTKALMDAYTPLISENGAAHAYVISEGKTYEWNGTAWVALRHAAVVASSSDNSVVVTPSGEDNQTFDITTDASRISTTSALTGVDSSGNNVSVPVGTVQNVLQQLLNTALASEVELTEADGVVFDAATRTLTVKETNGDTFPINLSTLTSTLADGNDGTYSITSGNGTVLNIDTRSASNPLSSDVVIGGTTLAAGTNSVQDALAALAAIAANPVSLTANAIANGLSLSGQEIDFTPVYTPAPFYNSNSLAVAGGLAVGAEYRLGDNNIYGLPHGSMFTVV